MTVAMPRKENKQEVRKRIEKRVKKSCRRKRTFFSSCLIKKRAMQGTDLRLGVLLECSTCFKAVEQTEYIYENFFDFHG